MNTVKTRLLLAHLLVCMVVLANGTLLAQAPADRIRTPRFTRLTVEDGLSNGAVHAIAQDSAGFVWFGTENGLNRYDGRRIKQYLHNPQDSTTIADVWVSAILTSRNGTVWVLTHGGLCRYNSRTDSFQRVSFAAEVILAGTTNYKPNMLLETSDGTIWIGARLGIMRYNPNSASDNTPRPHASTQIAAIDLRPTSDSSITALSALPLMVEKIMLAPRGAPSSGNGAGTASERILVYGIYDDKSSAIYEFNPADASFKEVLKHQRLLCPAPNENAFWVRDERTSSLIKIHSQTFAILEEYVQPLSYRLPPERTAAVVSGTHLWRTTDAGLQCFNTARGSSRYFYHNPKSAESLSSTEPCELLLDRSGVLWVGSFNNGVSKYAPHQFKFGVYRYNPYDENSLSDSYVRGLTEDVQGNLWVGTQYNGINKVNRLNDSILRYANNGEPLRRLNMAAAWWLLGDRNGMMWVTDAHLFEKDRRSGYSSAGISAEGSIHPIPQAWFEGKKLSHTIGFASQNRNGIQDSVIWASSRELQENKQPEAWYMCRLEVPRMLGSNVSAPLSAYKHSIYRVPQDMLGSILVQDALGTFHGVRDTTLYSWNPMRDTIVKRTPLPAARVITEAVRRMEISAYLRFDRKGRLWMFCKGGGAVRYDIKTGESLTLGVAEGLPNVNVYAVLEDYRGNYWISTDAGISEYNPTTKQFRHFGPADGLQGREFNRVSYFQSPSGEMFFGGVNGANTFFPEDTDPNPTPPLVALANLATPLRTLPSAFGDTIELRFEERSFRAEILALEYTDPARNRVAWKLEGFDAEWHISDVNDQNRFVNYTNLDAGSYRILVKAANSDGVWSEEQCALQIKILPAWWQTWWFRLAVALVLVSLGYAIVRWRVQRIQKRNIELEYQVLVRTSELSTANAELNFANQDLNIANAEVQIKNLELAENLEILRKTQKQLVESEKMAALGTLVAGVAHELNTPIGVAVTAASTMQSRAKRFLEKLEKDEPLLKKELRDFTADATEGTTITLNNLARAASLIQSFKRVAVDQHSDQQRQFLLTPYLRELAASLSPQFTGTGHRLDIGCAEEIEMFSYPGVIAQIITNFVVNSLSHGFKGFTDTGVMTIQTERVPISAHNAKECVIIRYTDNGRGIPSEILPRIFDPFFTTQQAQGGTGLGLNIVYNLVTQKLGGTLVCESILGKETCFTITIPIDTTTSANIETTHH